MRFLADMGVAMPVVEWLRGEGHETTHLREENLQRMTDNDIFRKVATEERILLTFDLHFGEILALSRECTVSVILFRLHNTCTAHLTKRLKITLQQRKEMLESGSVIVVEESRLRARRIPLRR
jgi:predicted nuclease of predicted toxin-antitoxin system